MVYALYNKRYRRRKQLSKSHINIYIDIVATVIDGYIRQCCRQGGSTMKRFVLVAFAFVCAVLIGVFSNASLAAGPQVIKGTGDGSTIVVYFTEGGHTKALADRAAQVLGADLYQILPAQPYTAQDLDYRNRSSRTTVEQSNPAARPAMLGTVDLTPYKTVVLVYPIWWNQAPRIMDTFVDSVNLNGKNVIPVVSCEGSSITNSVNGLRQHASLGAHWTNGMAFMPNYSDADYVLWLKAQ